MLVTNEFAVKSLNYDSSGKAAFDKSKKEESSETKKCKNCLKRVALHYVRCPYCRTGKFLYNEA